MRRISSIIRILLRSEANISVNAEKEQKEKIYEAFEEFWKKVEKIVEEKA